jgi:hypothetical protein
MVDEFPLCAMALSPAIAKEITDRHESYVDKRFKDRPPLTPLGKVKWWRQLKNHKMDLHNNKVGIRMASAVPSWTYVDPRLGMVRYDLMKPIVSRACRVALGTGQLTWLR